MSDEKRTTQARQPVNLVEKRDATTVAAVVSAGASVVSAGTAVYAAHQSGKKPPPEAPPEKEQ
jgi:hypothetical protein